MSEKRDYYEVLGVQRDATPDQIKKAYRQKARECHPDVNQHDCEADEKFKEINEAYDALKDPEKRQRYDQFGHQGVNGRSADYSGFGDTGFGDIFDMFFGGGGGRPGRRSMGQDGSDLRYDMELTLEEVSTGLEKILRLHRLSACEKCHGSGSKEGTSPKVCPQCRGAGQVEQRRQNSFAVFSSYVSCPQCHGQGYTISDPCSECQGQGRMRRTSDLTVKIPAGVESGMKIRLRGEGDAGAHGGSPGDLYVVIFVKPHKVYERRGDNIVSEIPLSFVQAALGDTITIPGLGGDETLHIPAGTQTGHSFTLHGKGLPNINHSGLGNHHVVVRIVTPTKLSEEQKKLLLDFAQTTGQEINPEEKHGFFEKLLGK